MNTTFFLRLKGPTAIPDQTFTTDSVGNFGPFTFALTGAAPGVYTAQAVTVGDIQQVVAMTTFNRHVVVARARA